jgi:7-carboxy-7-deazaguanine synthase
MALRIHEIYRSVQGESTHAGRPCTFVRTTACDLRCVWCDTPQAFVGGTSMELADVVAEVKRLGIDLVELTGGEPLLQKEIGVLASALMAAGAEVLCETGGHRDISLLPAGVVRIMDLKCPASGECDKNEWANIARLTSEDEVKFVVADRADFDWSLSVTKEHRLCGRVKAVLMSPVHGVCDPKELVEWIKESGLPLRLNLQLHKYVWGAEKQGV